MDEDACHSTLRVKSHLWAESSRTVQRASGVPGPWDHLDKRHMSWRAAGRRTKKRVGGRTKIMQSLSLRDASWYYLSLRDTSHEVLDASRTRTFSYPKETSGLSFATQDSSQVVYVGLLEASTLICNSNIINAVGLEDCSRCVERTMIVEILAL
jgi:hypothetical protein